MGSVVIKKQTAQLLEVEKLSPSISRYVFSCAYLHVILPGQHVEIFLGGSWRPYTIARHHENTFEIVVKIIKGGAASEVLKNIKQGNIVDVKFNDKIHDVLDKPGVMIGIGTGVVPLYTLVTHALELGVQHPILFLYGTRHEVDLIYEKKLHDLQKRYASLTVKTLSSDDTRIKNPDKKSTSDRIYNEVKSMHDRKIYISARSDIEKDLSRKLLSSGILAKNLYVL